MRPAFCLIPAILLTGCVAMDFGTTDRYHAEFHYSYDLQPGTRVNLQNLNGSVEITGTDGNKIEIAGTRNASTQEALEAMKIDIHNSGTSIDIRTVRPSDSGNVGARYAVRVPRSAILDRITTSNGSLRVSNATLGGHLKSSNGSIRLDKTTGVVDVQTSNSGITIDLNEAPKEGIHAQTSNGGITLKIPSTTAARLAADTSNGSVTTDFNVSDNGRASHLDATINGGGPLIQLKTSNGSISIDRH